MNRPLATLTLALACALALPFANAQKLYRWVDADGKVHYSDTIPPSEVDRARDQLNEQGRTVESVSRALTAEEQAEAAQAAKVAEEERKAKEAQAHMDKMLLTSYGEESDLKRAYDERFDLVKQSIESAKVGIRSQEGSLADLLAHAAKLEREGTPVGENIKKSIELSRSQVAQQAAYLEKRESEQIALQKEYDQTLARYRRLKAEAADDTKDSAQANAESG